jgi:hypothetical protein
MSPQTYTYTHAYTRAQAVVDQVDVLFDVAGIGDDARGKICRGVRERWLDAVGLWLERDGHMVYEIEARIRWSALSDSADVEFSTDLPGWEGTGSPEAIILGSRFAAKAAKHGLSPRYWARFTPQIYADPALRQRLCPLVGVDYGRGVPGWATTPTTRSLPLQDLREIGASERSAL